MKLLEFLNILVAGRRPYLIEYNGSMWKYIEKKDDWENIKYNLMFLFEDYIVGAELLEDLTKDVKIILENNGGVDNEFKC